MIKYSDVELYLLDIFVKDHNFKIVLLSQLAVMAVFVLINDITTWSNNILNNLIVLHLFKVRNVRITDASVNICLGIEKSIAFVNDNDDFLQLYKSTTNTIGNAEKISEYPK